MKRQNMTKKAFTLIELLVVIVILSILSTIAFVSFTGYQSTTRDSVRLSDMVHITKTVELYALENRDFPSPVDINEIYFNGAIAWNQGDFGKSENMGDAPTDPLTGIPYLYSTTHNGREYQVGSIMEGELPLANISQTHAGVDLAKAYIRGNYNGQTINVSTGSLDYILGVPSILASDILDAQLVTIMESDALMVHGFQNLPPSYSGTTFSHNSGVGFTPSISEIVVFQGDIEELSYPSNDEMRLNFIENLQTLYDGSTIQELESIHNLVVIDTSDTEQVEYLSSVIINENLGGDIEAPTKVSIGGGGSSSLTGWRALDPNCDIDDIVIGTQTWAGCNSTLGDGLEWGQEFDEIGTNSYTENIVDCYNYEGNQIYTGSCTGGDPLMLSSSKENQWYTATTGNGDTAVNNIWGKHYPFWMLDPACPTGWKVPSVEDFDLLETTLSCSTNSCGWEGHTTSPHDTVVGLLQIPLSGIEHNGYKDRGRIAKLWTSSTTSMSGRKPSYKFFYDQSSSYRTDFYSYQSRPGNVRCIKDTPL
ncbi:MAG: prepilin-type N-terminal cleavage/methylation domain-containing protein [Candidatus Gracilibacteria bacterium]|nr:prepilin-type N-terminal cleavage/methylation domain-containing protein [Candidatus Gracilibacteria bacterium]